MRTSQDGFLEHVKSLRAAAVAARAETLLAGDTLRALVRHEDRHWVLHPQFLTVLGGATHRTPLLHDESEAFVGWRPYVGRTWPAAADRALFRRIVGAAGLATPELFQDPRSAPNGVVVSSVSAASGRRVEGPFRSVADRPLRPEQGESYEPFVRGDLLKVWFWGETPICAGRVALPFVVGDGASTLGELFVRTAGLDRLHEADRAALLARCELVARHDGRSLSSVLPNDTRQPVDVGYGASPLHGGREILDLAARPDAAWLPAMRSAGLALTAEMPDDLRTGTLFTVDAVLDADDRPWLLDADCNPVVQPLMYAPMIQSLVASREATPPSPSPARDVTFAREPRVDSGASAG